MLNKGNITNGTFFAAYYTVVNRLEEIRALINNISLADRNASSANNRFLRESNEEITSRLEELSKSVEKTGGYWNLKATDYISILLAIVALIASAPALLYLLIAQFYRPKVEVIFGPYTPSKNTSIRWSDLSTLNIVNKTSKILSANVEIVTDKPWHLNPDLQNLFVLSGMKGGIPFRGFYCRSREMDIPRSSTLAIRFPLEAKPEKCFLQIVIYPKIQLSEFRLPRYFGEGYLRPIKETFEVTT